MRVASHCWLSSFVAPLVWLGSHVHGPSARAEPEHAPAPEHASAHTLLAQVCWLESSFSFDDCAAIVYVLERRARRADISLTEMALRYSSIRTAQPRARFARSLPDGDEPSWPSALNRRWAELRTHVADALARRIPDPCPRATHWGARNLPVDRARALDALTAGTWREVRCRVETANAFYVERMRPN